MRTLKRSATYVGEAWEHKEHEGAVDPLFLLAGDACLPAMLSIHARLEKQKPPHSRQQQLVEPTNQREPSCSRRDSRAGTGVGLLRMSFARTRLLFLFCARVGRCPSQQLHHDVPCRSNQLPSTTNLHSLRHTPYAVTRALLVPSSSPPRLRQNNAGLGSRQRKLARSFWHLLQPNLH